MAKRQFWKSCFNLNRLPFRFDPWCHPKRLHDTFDLSDHMVDGTERRKYFWRGHVLDWFFSFCQRKSDLRGFRVSFGPVFDVLAVLTWEHLLKCALHALPGILRALRPRFCQLNTLFGFLLIEHLQEPVALAVQLYELRNYLAQVFYL